MAEIYGLRVGEKQENTNFSTTERTKAVICHIRTRSAIIFIPSEGSAEEVITQRSHAPPVYLPFHVETLEDFSVSGINFMINSAIFFSSYYCLVRFTVQMTTKRREMASSGQILLMLETSKTGWLDRQFVKPEILACFILTTHTRNMTMKRTRDTRVSSDRLQIHRWNTGFKERKLGPQLFKYARLHIIKFRKGETWIKVHV